MINNITGVVVVWNTKDLIKRAYDSIRTFHPDMTIIIVDGSDMEDPCYKYINRIDDDNLILLHPGYNIGHGLGAHLGISRVQTPYFLLFDSDIEMLKSPLNDMLSLMEGDTYGIGHCQPKGHDGFDYGTYPHHADQKPVKYLHPYFALIQTSEYFKYPPLVHHGSPFIATMLDIHKGGLSGEIIKDFPGLGHSRKGDAPCLEYIRHEIDRCGGTGAVRLSKGLSHIEGEWDMSWTR